MFVDKVTVQVVAGDGGNGALSFRHEKFVDRGGPDGGDGGRGGNVIFKASRNQNTLAKFRYQKTLAAEAGAPGDKRRRHGKNGQDLIVAVPVGTLVTEADGQVLADFVTDDQQVVIAKGGQGGFGNAHFTSSTRQAPRIAEKGEKGDSYLCTLELKMIADAGLVGLPNAGKSTLLATISHAQPEIADYPFTTLTPNLGVVDINENQSLLMADIPGLIEGASQGKGLGDAFLRHVERTAVLVHLIDAYNDDVGAAYRTIQAELEAYSPALIKRPQLVVLSKIDGIKPKNIESKLAELKAVLPARTKLYAISSKTGAGVKELLYSLQEVVKKNRQAAPKKVKPSLPVLKLTENMSWQVTKTKDDFRVTGKRIERFAQRTDFNNPAGVQRLRDIMRKMGIQHELVRQGIEAGQTVLIGKGGKAKIKF